jgi:hypothetical protein
MIIFILHCDSFDLIVGPVNLLATVGGDAGELN